MELSTVPHSSYLLLHHTFLWFFIIFVLEMQMILFLLFFVSFCCMHLHFMFIAMSNHCEICQMFFHWCFMYPHWGFWNKIPWPPCWRPPCSPPPTLPYRPRKKSPIPPHLHCVWLSVTVSLNTMYTNKIKTCLRCCDNVASDVIMLYQCITNKRSQPVASFSSVIPLNNLSLSLMGHHRKANRPRAR